MKHSKLRVAAAAMAIVAATAGLAACTAQESGSGGPGESTVVEPATQEEVYDAVANNYEEMAEKYAPEVEILEDGTKIQRVPGLSDPYYSVMPFNNYYDTRNHNAENRGCGSCHGDLADTVANMYRITEDGEYYPHSLLKSNHGVSEWTVDMCMGCHNHNSTISKDGMFGDLMHSLHDTDAFTEENDGSCQSCHYMSDNGVELWDEVKHDVYRGITDLAADTLDGTFSYTQEHFSDGMFVYRSLQDGVDPKGGDWQRMANTAVDEPRDPETDGWYDSWVITFDGLIEGGEPVGMSLREMLDKYGTETHTMTQQCAENIGAGSPMLDTVQVTGINLADVLDDLGVAAEAKSVQTPYGLAPLEWIYDEDAPVLLALEFNGELLSWDEGYPVTLASSHGSANYWYKWPTSLTVVEDELDMDTYYDICHKRDENGEYIATPNAGFANIREGQIFEAGEPIVFEGWTYADDTDVTSVELSFDGGLTWTACEFTDNKLPYVWTWWTYEWTPPAEGAYRIMVRSCTPDGMKTQNPYEIMFNVQDGSTAAEDAQ